MSEERIGIAYVTKYALTRGVIEVHNAEVCDVTMLRYTVNGYVQHAHGEGREWHRTPESAAAKVEAMRLAKIKSLEKQAAKMSAHKVKWFTVVAEE